MVSACLGIFPQCCPHYNQLEVYWITYVNFERFWTKKSNLEQCAVPSAYRLQRASWYLIADMSGAFALVPEFCCCCCSVVVLLSTTTRTSLSSLLHCSPCLLQGLGRAKKAYRRSLFNSICFWIHLQDTPVLLLKRTCIYEYRSVLRVYYSLA